MDSPYAPPGARKDAEKSLKFWEDVEAGRNATTQELARERHGLKNLDDLVSELYRCYRSFAESDSDKKSPREEADDEYVSKLKKTARSFRACARSLKMDSRWKRLSQRGKLHYVKKTLGECGSPNFDELADAVAYAGRVIEKYGNDLSLFLFAKMNAMKVTGTV